MSEAGSIKMWVLAFVVLAGVGFGALVGIGCAIGANACPFTKQKPQTTTDGQVLFLNNCAVCHGINGEGSRSGPPLKTGEAATLDLIEVKGKVSNGKPLLGMPAFKRSLNAAQIEAVARYVLSLRTAS